MQKYICSIIMGMALCFGANAATMCTASDTVTVVLDPSINGTSSDYDNATKTWSVTFDYGTIYGIASCNNISGGSQFTINTTDAMSQADNSGDRCWCKMVLPAGSAWAYGHSVAPCSNSCTSYCATWALRYSAMRGGLFRSAGI